MRAKPGDKIRLKNGRHRGARGVLERAEGDTLIVRLDNGQVVRVQPGVITNFSLAARKAWRRMPERRVGRPKGSGVVHRISVTLRIDRELWEHFKHAEAVGVITDRTATINAWIREGLAQFAPEPPNSGN